MLTCSMGTNNVFLKHYDVGIMIQQLIAAQITGEKSRKAKRKILS